MRYNLKVRLALIGKTQRWLLEELRNAGFHSLSIPRLSAIVNGHDRFPSAGVILDKAEEIVRNYEDSQKR